MDQHFYQLKIEQDQFRPLIDRECPLEEIVEAFHCVEAGQKTSNVVIRL